MYPELFKIGPFVIHSYGVLLALAFLVGISIIRKRAINNGEKEEDIINLAYIIIIASILGARLLYVLFHLSEFSGRWKYVIWPVQEDGTIGIGGLILLGGVLSSILATYIYLKHKKLNFLKYTDIITPVLPLGIFFGRLGCFFNGCCFGKECDLPWGVSFPSHSPAGAQMGDIHLHPTQLYESLYNLILFLIIMYASRHIKVGNGIIFSFFLIGYGIERFIIDFFRQYESQMFVLPGLEFNQVISIIMIISGLILLYKNKINTQNHENKQI